MKKALVDMVKALARLIDSYYDRTSYDRETSALMSALADWVKKNGGEI